MRTRRLSQLRNLIETEEGRWELTPNHEVTYRVKGGGMSSPRAFSGDPSLKEVLVRGALVAAEPDALVLAVTTREDETRTVTELLKLEGKWELDSKNRITFSVKRGSKKSDKFVFQGAWEVNDRHQVVYTYETREVTRGRDKKKRRLRQGIHELVFKGQWDISEKNRLTYFIGGDSDSAFRFRGAFQTKSVLAKEGELRYQAGVEIRRQTAENRRQKKGKRLSFPNALAGNPESHLVTIVLFGKWKLSRDLELSFELESKNGKKQSLTFGATYVPRPSSGVPPVFIPDEITLQLTSRTGEGLGLELILTQDFFEGNAEAFLRFAKSVEDSRVEAGVSVKW